MHKFLFFRIGETLMTRFTSLLMLILFCSPVFGATMSTSATAPTVDGADIASLTGTADAGGDQGHLWNNRPRQGQSFTTGGNAAGYTLSAVTIRARVDQGGGTTSPNWDIRIGTIDGSNVFSPIATESATGVNIPNGNPSDWVTWTLAATVNLSPNTLYGFDVFPDGNGFITMNDITNPYAGGSGFSSGDNLPASPPNPLTLRTTVDRNFHVDMEVIPEPSTFALAALGLLGLLACGRRRRR